MLKCSDIELLLLFSIVLSGLLGNVQLTTWLILSFLVLVIVHMLLNNEYAERIANFIFKD
ncbi:hypothetical protein [Ligilactobacillus cholophilus]|uniref:hypothetical protein n=1 Tax=Ligilactobacillus cholophilus TaxID=3050131 RepID=UPI0025B075ED|nr:hypothetical protein [Ligilactobacillus cholophilus]